ncbi:MAG: hypothetical protein Q7T12_00550 [Flavobacterium sp.]|nr:hypothetical protein [Flavobacterium sp.]
MENAILLQNVTPKDLEELITKVVKEQLQEFVKMYQPKILRSY